MSMLWATGKESGFRDFIEYLISLTKFLISNSKDAEVIPQA